MKNKQITVVIEQGVVQAVHGIPDGYEVRIRDYDNDGVAIDLDSPNLYIGTTSGDFCVEQTWSQTDEYGHPEEIRRATQEDLDERFGKE